MTSFLFLSMPLSKNLKNIQKSLFHMNLSSNIFHFKMNVLQWLHSHRTQSSLWVDAQVEFIFRFKNTINNNRYSISIVVGLKMVNGVNDLLTYLEEWIFFYACLGRLLCTYGIWMLILGHLRLALHTMVANNDIPSWLDGWCHSSTYFVDLLPEQARMNIHSLSSK